MQVTEWWKRFAFCPWGPGSNLTTWICQEVDFPTISVGRKRSLYTARLATKPLKWYWLDWTLVSEDLLEYLNGQVSWRNHGFSKSLLRTNISLTLRQQGAHLQSKKLYSFQISSFTAISTTLIHDDLGQLKGYYFCNWSISFWRNMIYEKPAYEYRTLSRYLVSPFVSEYT